MAIFRKMNSELIRKTIQILTEENCNITIHKNPTLDIDDIQPNYIYGYLKFSSWGSFKNELTENIEKILFDFTISANNGKLDDGLKNFIIKKLEKALKGFSIEDLNGKKFYKPPNLSKFYYPTTDGQVEKQLDTIPREHEYIILKYTKTHYNLCKSFLDRIKKIQNFDSNMSHKKLRFKLSVAEISLLFKLLYNEKLIEADNKEEIYRFISNSFSSKSQNNISKDSIKNKFLTPDHNAINKIDEVLIHLKHHVNKLKE